MPRLLSGASEVITHLSARNEYPQQKEDHEHAKHLRHKPTIPLHPAPILEQLSLRTLHIRHHVLHIIIDARDLLALLGHQLRQLAEDARQLRDGGLDGGDGLAARLHVGVGPALLHEQQLRGRGLGGAAAQRATLTARVQRQHVGGGARRREERRAAARRRARRCRVQRRVGARPARRRRRRHGPHEGLGALARGADGPRAHLQRVLEARRHAAQALAQQQQHGARVLGFLVRGGGGGGARRPRCLQRPDRAVQR